MRSMLIQASSVEKAVEKAWISAGRPTEYTIKILDFGEKGFLGITKRQAIVSIIYEPQRQTSVSKPQPVVKQKQFPPQRDERQKRQHFTTQQGAPQRVTRPQQAMPQQTTPQQPQKEIIFWTDDLVADLTTWIKETVAILGVQPSIKSHVNKKVVTLTFSDPIMENPEDERMLFPALSALVMQFLRKKNKKKFHGFQIVLASKRPDNK